MRRGIQEQCSEKKITREGEATASANAALHGGYERERM